MPSAGNTAFAFVNQNGGSTNNTESNVQTLNSHTACTARSLSVLVTAAPGGVLTQTFKVRANGADVISCTITGSSTTCNSGSSSGTITADVTINMSLAQPGGAPSSTALWAFLCQPS